MGSWWLPFHPVPVAPSGTIPTNGVNSFLLLCCILNLKSLFVFSASLLKVSHVITGVKSGSF